MFGAGIDSMNNSNFSHLEEEFPLLYNVAQAAELSLYADPVVSLFKLRQFGELLTDILFVEHHLEYPSDNTFHTRLRELEYSKVLPGTVKDMLFALKAKGNLAVHGNNGSLEDAKSALFASFKISKWFYSVYATAAVDISDVKFRLPQNLDARHALSELEREHAALQRKFEKLEAERIKTPLSEDVKKAIYDRSEKAARKVDMDEAETRELQVDPQLRQAGWEANSNLFNYRSKKTLPQRGRNMAIAEWPVGNKWADYALFIGTELYGLIEAKRYASDISTDLRQCKIYAELVEVKHEANLLGKWGTYRVPFLFSTNGRPYLKQLETKSGIWFLNVKEPRAIAHPLQGWYSPEGLRKLFDSNREEAEKKLRSESKDFLTSDTGLRLRPYQIKAIDAVEKSLAEHPEKRTALLAMATGTGKTRTIIGLCYRLIQSNRFRRILFLVDRTLLGEQAVDHFKDNRIVGLNTFSEIYDVRGLTKVPDIDTRLQFATVQGMVKRLFYSENDEGIPTVDQYDCIIIDEAHRGYLLDREIEEDDLEFKDQRDYVSKYRMVLDYFDAYRIGLTATPALHTTQIFGSAVYTYSYREAVIDGFLIDHDPPHKLKTKLNEEGIKWKKGEKPKALDTESNSIVELEALEDELAIEIEGFNKLVITESFNRTIVQQLVKELDPEGDEKTLVFAATDEHADRVVQYFKEEFKKSGVDIPDDAVQKITGKSYNPKEQLVRFRNEKFPNIAVTVDLLTTGIDVPSICNLVFLRRVKSRILYEQMLGRATRKCDEIGKEAFQIYDAVRLYEALSDYTQMKPVVTNPNTSFQQLVEEFQHIDSEKRSKQQVEQILAKLQRKKRHLTPEMEDRFKYVSKGIGSEDFIEKLKNSSTTEAKNSIKDLPGLWSFLDELRPQPSAMLVSEHQDEYRGAERGYGNAKKPEDYLENFAKFIKDNQNKITALNIVCSRPTSLDKTSLKQLLMALDQEGYNEKTLNAAWREAKNEDIAADIISFIRTLAVGSVMVSHEERIKRAVNDIRKMKTWTKVQEKWINRIELQLLKETVVRVEDLDASPFNDAGGFDRLNKIFEDQLEQMMNRLNEKLYADVA